MIDIFKQNTVLAWLIVLENILKRLIVVQIILLPPSPFSPTACPSSAHMVMADTPDSLAADMQVGENIFPYSIFRNSGIFRQHYRDSGKCPRSARHQHCPNQSSRSQPRTRTTSDSTHLWIKIEESSVTNNEV